VARRRAKSIVVQLTTWYVSSLFVIVFFSTSFLYWTLSSAITSENQAILRDRLQTVTSLLGSGEPDSLLYTQDRIKLEWPSRHSERIYVRVRNNSGEPLLESPSMPKEVPEEIFSRSSIAEFGSRNVLTRKLRAHSGSVYLTAARTVLTADNEIETIFVAMDLAREESILANYRNRLLSVLVFVLLISAFLGRKFAVTAFRPVEDIVATTRRIRSSTLHERIAGTDLPHELETLASTVNEMLDRLEDSFMRLSRFSSDIAHELRTPINNIRGEIEVALGKSRGVEEYREILSSSLEESGRMSKLIDSMLFLAKAEHPEMQIRKEMINVRNELYNIQEFYEATAAEEEVTIRISAGVEIELEVERTLFQRAVGNIVSNAINYTPVGGTILIEARLNSKTVEILIQDNGQGISEADIPLVFDRFYRADPARKATKLGGFGLGLTIVKSIVSLHQGHIRIDSQLGKGTAVTMSFPIRDDSI
jgi:two-component system heavy metal sensor histidine kinase CusS